MKTIFFDLETNGLLHDVDRIHLLVASDGKECRVFRRNDSEDTIEQGLQYIMTADRLVAHNGIKFDVPVIEKLTGLRIDSARVYDTLVVSRLIYADLSDVDTKLMQEGRLPSNLFRSHSLEAWGHRLKLHKLGYTGGWEKWSQDMEDYCVRDVEVLVKLYQLLESKDYSAQAIELEHQVAWICARQEQHGFAFDQSKAVKLYTRLIDERLRLERELKAVFTPRYIPEGKPFTPKADNKRFGYAAGAVFQKIELTEFNPGSRDHIARWLKAMRGWTPKDFTNDGRPKVDEAILGKLAYPEAKLLSDYLLLQKRIGQLAEGDQAWLKHARGGRIHGSVITNGAVTGRATHAFPNLAQVPSVKKSKEGQVLMGMAGGFGHECRDLFTVDKGKKLVGADLSGLELRCLAHFMATWDKGAYGKVLLEGDIHTENQKAAGLATRAQAKTFISMG